MCILLFCYILTPLLTLESSLQLLDLCILDINSLDYRYGVLAAAAFCHFTSFETVHKVLGELSDLGSTLRMEVVVSDLG